MVEKLIGLNKYMATDKELSEAMTHLNINTHLLPLKFLKRN